MTKRAIGGDGKHVRKGRMYWDGYGHLRRVEEIVPTFNNVATSGYGNRYGGKCGAEFLFRRKRRALHELRVMLQLYRHEYSVDAFAGGVIPSPRSERIVAAIKRRFPNVTTRSEYIDAREAEKQKEKDQ